MAISPILGLTLIDPAQPGRFDAINALFAAFESSTDALHSHVLSTADVVVTPTEFTTFGVHKATGNTVARTLTFPNTPRVFAVWNSGTANLTVAISGGGTVVVGPGHFTMLQSNGTVISPFAKTGAPTPKFTDLADAPASYSGAATQRVRANSGQTALEFHAAGTEKPPQVDTSTEYLTTAPGTPLIGLTGYIRKRAFRKSLAFIDPRGQTRDIASMLARKSVQYVVGAGNLGDGALSSLAPYAFGFDGGACFPDPSYRMFSGENFLSFQPLRTGLISSHGINQQFYWNAPNTRLASGSVAGAGGFFVVYSFGVAEVQSDAKFLIGLAENTGLMTTTWASNVTTLGAVIGLIKEPGDSHWNLIQKTSSSTSFTKTDLGSSFPANTAGTDYYEFRLYCEPGGVPYYSLERLNTGDFTEGQFTNSATLPPTTTALFPQMRGQTSGVTSGAIAIDFMRIYIETELDVS